MKRISAYLSLLFALLLMGCNGSTGLSKADFTENVYHPAYASGFDVFSQKNSDDGENTSHLVTIRNPWQGATDVEQQLLILRGEDKAPADFEGQVVRTPIRKVVCLSSSYVAMFDRVGETDRVVGVSGIDYISNPRIQELRAEGKVHDIGYDTNLNFELLTSLDPDLVLLFGITGENSVLTGKLRELSIPYIYIGDYIEESPLGKAEWMVLIGDLCDKLDESRATFQEIADRYNTLKEKIRVDSTTKRPLVMLNTPYRDTWFMPPVGSYMVRLIEDAGGKYIYPQNTSGLSKSIDIEEAYLLATQADVWINTGMWSSLEDLQNQAPKFTRVPSVAHRRVWNNNLRATPAGGSDFWESGVVNPDLVLEDLHRLMLDEKENYHYYKRLE